MTRLHAAHATDRFSRPREHVSKASPMPQHDDVQATLARLEALATVMDSAVRIPGTAIVMGLDALLGLLPVIGDAISGAIGSYLIWEARRLGASRFVIARIATNTTIDTVLGSIPIVGDMFDIAFKSNRKNIALLRAHLEKHGARSPARNDKVIEATFSAETVG
ncbi:MAG: DUF4112 domain-containing protein [Hyphomicrobium sp.]